jgi:hypothetical protein
MHCIKDKRGLQRIAYKSRRAATHCMQACGRAMKAPEKSRAKSWDHEGYNLQA